LGPSGPRGDKGGTQEKAKGKGLKFHERGRVACAEREKRKNASEGGCKKEGGEFIFAFWAYALRSKEGGSWGQVRCFDGDLEKKKAASGEEGEGGRPGGSSGCKRLV